jgi:hypothetical protein
MYIVKNTPQTRENPPLHKHACDLERKIMNSRDREHRAYVNRLISQRQHMH